jgi:hypothetical protein
LDGSTSRSFSLALDGVLVGEDNNSLPGWSCQETVLKELVMTEIERRENSLPSPSVFSTLAILLLATGMVLVLCWSLWLSWGAGVSPEQLARHPFWTKPMTAADIDMLADRAMHPGRSGDLFIRCDGHAEEWTALHHPLTDPVPTPATPRFVVLSGKFSSRQEFFRALLGAMNHEMTREDHKARFGP